MAGRSPRIRWWFIGSGEDFHGVAEVPWRCAYYTACVQNRKLQRRQKRAATRKRGPPNSTKVRCSCPRWRKGILDPAVSCIRALPSSHIATTMHTASRHPHGMNCTECCRSKAWRNPAPAMPEVLTPRWPPRSMDCTRKGGRSRHGDPLEETSSGGAASPQTGVRWGRPPPPPSGGGWCSSTRAEVEEGSGRACGPRWISISPNQGRLVVGRRGWGRGRRSGWEVGCGWTDPKEGSSPQEGGAGARAGGGGSRIAGSGGGGCSGRGVG